MFGRERSTSTAAPDRHKPAMAFRVGITGTRDVAPTAAQSIGDAFAEVFQGVIAAMVVARGDARAARCYDSDRTPGLRCISPLAEGADQLFAEVALAQRVHARDNGVELGLEVVIPFAAQDYKNAFDGQKQGDPAGNYDRLVALAAGRVFELDGLAADDIARPLGYEAAGRTVVRNADLVIALWDDRVAPKGRGGTRDTVHFALRSGVPVWWIDPSGTNPPRFLEDEADLRGRTHETPPPARRARYLQSVLQPPEPKTKDGLLGRCHRDPLLDYLAEPLGTTSNCRLLHAGTLGSARRIGHERRPGKAGPDGALAPLSDWYRHRPRTSYFVVLVLAALALGVAVIGLAHLVDENFALALELALLLAIAALVGANSFGHWREKSISCRLLGELTRPAPYLNALGWSLPFAEMRRSAGTEGLSWTEWLASAHARDMPLANGAVRDELEDLRNQIVGELIDPRIRCLENRRAKCRGASAWFGRAGSATFGLRLLPLARLSSRMLADIKDARARILAIDLQRPLASQMLAEELLKVTSAMLSDMTGRAELFRSRAVEV